MRSFPLRLTLALACLTLAGTGLAQTNLHVTFALAAAYESGLSVEPMRQIEGWVATATTDSRLRRRLEPELARLLKPDTTYEAKRFACQQLAIIGTDDSVNALAALLVQPETVDVACQALVAIPDGAAGAALRAAVPSVRGPARVQVLKSLGTRRDSAAVPLLAGLVNDADPTVAEAAIASLGRVGTTAAIKALAPVRRSDDASRRAWAAEATLVAADRQAESVLAKGVDDLYVELLDARWPLAVRRGALVGLMRLDADRGEQRIIELLRDGDPVLRPVAIARVPSLNGLGVASRFALELPKLAPFEQALLVTALGERGDAAALPAVQALLTSRDPEVRMAVIVALGRLGNAGTVFPLSRALMNADAAETRAIEQSLTQLKGGDDVDRALMARLRDRMAGPKPPMLAALIRRNSRIAGPLFLAETRSSDPAVARLAFQGLSRQATAADLPRLLEALAQVQGEARAGAEAAVAQVIERLPRPAAATEPVRQALSRAPDASAQGSLLRLLPVCGDADALALLEAAVQTPGTRDVAVRALADWPGDLAWDGLLREFNRETNAGQRAVLLRGLTRLAGEQNGRPNATLIARYRQLLAAAREDAERKMVLGALAGCLHPDALQLALGQLTQPGVRAEATQAVKAIAEAIKAQHPQAAQDALKQVQ